MKDRLNISSGAVWEDIVGYSRAVRVGNVIEVSGTVAADGEDSMYPFEPYEQTHYILLKIRQALRDAGADLEHVVRTRIYVVDMSDWRKVAQAHGEFFKHIKPATTLVEVSALIRAELVVEIEATAIVPV